MADPGLVRELQEQVGRAGRAGLHGTPAFADGFRVELADGGVYSLTPREIERIIESVEDDRLQWLMALRLGVGDARTLTPLERTETLRAEFGARGGFTRTNREWLKLQIATLLAHGVDGKPPENLYGPFSVEDFSRFVTLPDMGVGVMREVTRRVIVSSEEGLTAHRLHRFERWTGASRPKYEVLDGGELAIERARAVDEGLRHDLVIKFKPLKKGERHELVWERRADMASGSLTPAEPHVFWHTPWHPTAQAKFVIRLGAGMGFSSVFRFEGVYEADRGQPDIGLYPVHPEGTTVQATWKRPVLSRTFGLRVHLR